jgi:hypothetical protein
MINLTQEEKVRTTRRQARNSNDLQSIEVKETTFVGKKRKRKLPDFYIPLKVLSINIAPF